MAFTGPAVFPSQPQSASFAGSYPGTQAVPGSSEFTGDVIAPTNNLYPGISTFAGQGNLSLLDVYISFSDVSVAAPVWTWISPNKIRQWRIARTEGETGTAELVLDNRNRDFDPTYAGSSYYPNVRPLNRIWLRQQFNGKTNSMFMGYAESYDQQWPGGGWSDAVAVVAAADELKILALNRLPLTNPPRTSYQDVVAFDNPSAYWSMDDDPAGSVQPPAISVVDASGVPETEDNIARKKLVDDLRGHWKKPVGRKAPLSRKAWRKIRKRVTPPPERYSAPPPSPPFDWSP